MKTLYITIYLFITLVHFTISTPSYLKYYVDSASTNNNTECGLTIDSPCSNIESVLYSYNSTDIPLIIEMAGGNYYQDGNTGFQLAGINLTIQAQPNSNVNLNTGDKLLLSVAGNIINNTIITIRGINVVNSTGFIYMYIPSSNINVSLLIDNCTFSNINKFDVLTVSQSYNKLDNQLSVTIRDSIFNNIQSRLLKSYGANVNINNTLITNNNANVILDLNECSVQISGIRYISNQAVFHLSSVNSNLTIYDSTFQDNIGSTVETSYLVYIRSGFTNIISNTNFNGNTNSYLLFISDNNSSTISNSKFTKNIPQYSELLHITGSSLSMDSCIFNDNTLLQSIVYSYGDVEILLMLNINNSIFYNNSFTDNDSVKNDIYLIYQTTLIENTVFNETEKINSITCSSSKLTLNNNKVIGNSNDSKLCKNYQCKIYGTDEKCRSNSLSKGAIAGIVIGVLIGIVAFIVIIVYVIHKRRHHNYIRV